MKLIEIAVALEGLGVEVRQEYWDLSSPDPENYRDQQGERDRAVFVKADGELREIATVSLLENGDIVVELLP